MKTIRERILELLKEDDVFWNNEIRANIFVCTQMYLLCGILVLTYLFAKIGVLEVPLESLRLMVYINIPLALAAAVIANIFKGQKHWIKYMFCIVTVAISVSLTATVSMFVTLIICIPVILSVRYYSKKLTVVVAVVTVVSAVISEILNAYHGLIDLNLIPIPAGTVINVGSDGNLRAALSNLSVPAKEYLSSLFRGSFLPRMMFFNIIAFTCIELAGRAREMVTEQIEISKKTESMKTELDMATKIQTGMLPRIFPPYPERSEFDIYATMEPAKEVGGDFYDFFLIDDDHLGVVMADVSGKGVPAALFMMASKILIKSFAVTNQSPAKIAELVNEQICEENSAEMFVTAWIGIIEISTGKVTYVDCGHEYPALYRKETGKYELVKGNKCFVLGGMSGIPYRDSELTMKPGDTLLLYTDGVPEANDADNRLFGMERMIEALNDRPETDPEKLLPKLRASVDAFVNGAPQFDDLTMLAFHLK